VLPPRPSHHRLDRPVRGSGVGNRDYFLNKPYSIGGNRRTEMFPSAGASDQRK